jgi:hypothetical protein
MGAGVWRAVITTAKGLEPLKQCSQPGSLNPGAALESDGMVTTLKTNLIAGSPRQRLILERLEPCEGKLSRTVLRGA